MSLFNLSPAIFKFLDLTMRPKEITAISVVPPPMSIIMEPTGIFDRKPDADRRRHRLFHQHDYPSAGTARRVVYCPRFHVGRAGGHSDQDSRPG